MAYRNVLLLGGTGFLGTSVAHLLYKQGCRITIPTRRRSRTTELTMCPTVELVEADVHDEATLEALVAGKDAVINLVGILHGGHGQPYSKAFAQAHVELPKKLAAACAKAGVRRVLHVSALNADPKGPSQYLRSKGDGEIELHALGNKLDLTIFRPSVIFGPGDSFLNMFADMQKIAPVVPLGKPDAAFQPVFVGDVAQVIAESLQRPESIGQTYILVGPKQYSLKELVNIAGAAVGKQRPVYHQCEVTSRLMAGVLELLPKPPLSVDNLDSMDVDSVSANTPLPFGLHATAIETVVPAYLSNRNPRGRYDAFRVKAGR